MTTKRQNTKKKNKATARPTLKDVAGLAGVRVSTVSDILNHSKNNWSSQATRERVFEAAKSLGYRPNRTARSLRYGKTGIIGVISNSHSLNRRFLGIDETAYDSGYATMVTFNAGKPEMEDRLILNYIDLGVDGLIVYPSDAGSHTQLRKLVDSGFPLVTLDGFGRLDFECDDVSPDFEEIGRVQARHLLEIHRKRICILTTDPKAKINGIREQGIVKEVEQATGAPPLIISLRVPANQEVTSFDCLYPQIAEIINARGGEFDAVITLDSLATIVIRAACETGIRIPEDLAVVGSGNTMLSSHNMVSLTSVNTDDEWIGTKAFELLMDRINNRLTEKALRQVYSKHRLLIRQSTMKTV